ncbi:hypothetical protein DRN44_05905 [Thermococci archaeon]|nr:MAG: hypothetical protein DRN44_05905 [Thermococci archaeon]
MYKKLSLFLISAKDDLLKFKSKINSILSFFTTLAKSKKFLSFLSTLELYVKAFKHDVSILYCPMIGTRVS